MRILLLLLAASFFISCSPKIIQSSKTVEKDSVHVDSTTQRIVKKIKGDSSGLSFNLSELPHIELTPPGQIIYPEIKKEIPLGDMGFIIEDSIVFHKTQKQGRLTQTVDISKSGKVKITCKEDSLSEVIEKQRITIEKFKNTVTVNTDTVQCSPKSKWSEFCEWFTIVVMALIAGAVLYRFRGLLKIPW